MKISIKKKVEPKIPITKKLTNFIRVNPLFMVFSLASIIATSCIVIVLSAYFLSFGGGLTTDHDKWGMFGDYVGGTLNPILAFLSFLALLFTISLQSKELKISNETLRETKGELEQSRKIAEKQSEFYRNESDKSDVIKAIDSVHSEIKELFTKRVDFCPENNTMGWFFSNSASSASAELIPKNGDAVSQNDRILLADISEYIMELSGYLHEYISKFGSSSVSFYYQRRYLTAKTRLVNNGFLIDMALQGFNSPGHGWSAPVNPSLTNQSSRPLSASAE